MKETGIKSKMTISDLSEFLGSVAAEVYIEPDTEFKEGGPIGKLEEVSTGNFIHSYVFKNGSLLRATATFKGDIVSLSTYGGSGEISI